ncbi:MAG: DUF4405 domain-containing protein [Chloroflexota bacterium]
MDRNARKFNTRAFVTLMIAFSSLGLPVTGIANHVYGFSPLTTTRHAWMSAHNALGLLFVVFLTWHVVLNRRALWNHIKGVTPRLPLVSRETMLAGTVMVFMLMLFVGHAFIAGGS